MNVYMGYACADITPEEQAEMIGFARPDNLSKGILHRLEASVMVLKSTEETCCLVTIDSLGFTTERSGICCGRKSGRNWHARQRSNALFFPYSTRLQMPVRKTESIISLPVRKY